MTLQQDMIKQKEQSLWSCLGLVVGASNVTAKKAASVHWNPLWFQDKSCEDFLQMNSRSKAKGMSFVRSMVRKVRLSARLSQFQQFQLLRADLL